MSVAARALRNPIGWAVLLVLLVLACASVFSVVPETTQALVVRMGQPQRMVNAWAPRDRFGDDGAGLIAHVPLIEQVIFVDKRARTLDEARQPILSSDGVPFEADVFARYRIVDPLRLYLSAQGDEGRVADALKPVLGAALRDAFARLTAAEVRAGGDASALEAVRERLDRVARQYGATVLDVRVSRLALPDGAALDGATERMRADRQQQAAAIRADGMKAAAGIRAQADTDAARIYADAFGQDPQFYDFYRAMQSYRATFGVDGATEGGTTIVLPTDSPYLRYFSGRSGK